MARLLALHGPNLNLLGTREPGIYGHTTLAVIDADLAERATAAGHVLESFQSNAEHALVDRIQAARGNIDFILINPAAFTHTSVAIRDALAAVGIPFIEVHLSNPHAREPFRHTSYFTDLAVGIVAGFGPLGYGLALLSGATLYILALAEARAEMLLVVLLFTYSTGAAIAHFGTAIVLGKSRALADSVNTF